MRESTGAPRGANQGSPLPLSACMRRAMAGRRRQSLHGTIGSVLPRCDIAEPCTLLVYSRGYAVFGLGFMALVPRACERSRSPLHTGYYTIIRAKLITRTLSRYGGEGERARRPLCVPQSFRWSMGHPCQINHGLWGYAAVLRVGIKTQKERELSHIK